jgi:hypothetical protein
MTSLAGAAAARQTATNAAAADNHLGTANSQCDIMVKINSRL